MRKKRNTRPKAKRPVAGTPLPGVAAPTAPTPPPVFRSKRLPRPEDRPPVEFPQGHTPECLVHGTRGRVEIVFEHEQDLRAVLIHFFGAQYVAEMERDHAKGTSIHEFRIGGVRLTLEGQTTKALHLARVRGLVEAFIVMLNDECRG